MSEPKEAPLFLDTSIQIARWIHSQQAKMRIQERIDNHNRTVTGLVVRQEFKRRLLKEADYLLRLLHRYRSFDEVNHHVIRLPEPWMRKRNICLQTLAQVHGGTDKEKTDRLRLYLRSLLVDGMRRFDQRVDTVRKDSGCGCAKHAVVEKEAFRKYDLGIDRCSRIGSGECGIVSFLANRKEHAERILEKLRSLPEGKKSAELVKTERFLENLMERLDQVQGDGPVPHRRRPADRAGIH